MFSLIISIIAIALVAALALASIYYGGSAFQEGSTDAEASTVINQGQQIQGAVTLADVDEAAHATVSDLINGDYLKENPSVRDEQWELYALATTEEVALIGVVNDEVCLAIEQQRDASVVAASTTAPATADDVKAFGCVAANLGTATTGFTAYYKL